MNIGEALRRKFEGKTVDLTIGTNVLTEQPIYFHYGNQKELVKWTQANSNKPKYPLVWYVIKPYKEEPNDFKSVSSNLIILHSFQDWQNQYSWLNDERYLKSYDAVIEPVWEVVKDTLSSTPSFLQVMGKLSDKYIIKDEPNFGVSADGIRTSQSDFTTKNKKGEKSITIDIVDGRIIELEFRIKTKCI